MLTIQSGTKTTEKPNTPKRYNLIANSKSKEFLAVEIYSGRSAILKALTLNWAMPCSIVYQLLIFVFYPTLSNWTPAGLHIAQIKLLIRIQSRLGRNCFGDLL